MKKYWKKIARLKKDKYNYIYTAWTTATPPFFKSSKTRYKKEVDKKIIKIYNI